MNLTNTSSQVKNFSTTLREPTMNSTANKNYFSNSDKIFIKGKESFYNNKNMNSQKNGFEVTKEKDYFEKLGRSGRSPNHGLRKLGKSLSHSKEKSPKTSNKINTKEHIFETPLDKSTHHPQELVNEALNMLEKLRLDYNKQKDLTEISLKYYSKVNDHTLSQQEIMANSGSSFNKRYKAFENKQLEDSQLDKQNILTNTNKNNSFNMEINANSSERINNMFDSNYKSNDLQEPLSYNQNNSAINYISAGIHNSMDPNYIDKFNNNSINNINNNNSDFILDRSNRNNNSSYNYNKISNNLHQNTTKNLEQVNYFNNSNPNILDNQHIINSTNRNFQTSNYMFGQGVSSTPSNRNFDTYKIPGYPLNSLNTENERFSNFNYNTNPGPELVKEHSSNNFIVGNSSPSHNHSFSIKNNNLGYENFVSSKQFNKSTAGLIHDNTLNKLNENKTLGAFSSSYVEKPSKDHIIDFVLRVLDLSQLIYYFEIKCINFKDLLLLDKNDLIELDLDLVARNRIKTFSEAFNKHCRIHNMEEIIKFFFRFKAFIFNPGFLGDFLQKLQTNSKFNSKNEFLNHNEENYELNNTFNIETDRNKDIKQTNESNKIEEENNSIAEDDKETKNHINAEVGVKKNLDQEKKDIGIKKDNDKKYYKPSNIKKDKKICNNSKSKLKKRNSSQVSKELESNRESSSLIIFNRKSSNPKNFSTTSLLNKNDSSKNIQNSKISNNTFKNSGHVNINISDEELENQKSAKINIESYSFNKNKINPNSNDINVNIIDTERENQYNRLLLESTKGLVNKKSEIELPNKTEKNTFLESNFAMADKQIQNYLADYQVMKEKNEAVNQKVIKLLSSISGNSSNDISQNQFNLRLSGITTKNYGLQSTNITKYDNEQTSNRNYYASSSEGNNTSCSIIKEKVSKTMENKNNILSQLESKNQIYNTVNNIKLKK
jgi:hypothetical protein